MREHIAKQDIDPGLWDVIMALNEAGFRTWLSCSGHPERGVYSGYVLFEEKYSHQKILRTLQEHGLNPNVIKDSVGVWSDRTFVSWPAKRRET